MAVDTRQCRILTQTVKSSTTGATIASFTIVRFTQPHVEPYRDWAGQGGPPPRSALTSRRRGETTSESRHRSGTRQMHAGQALEIQQCASIPESRAVALLRPSVRHRATSRHGPPRGAPPPTMTSAAHERLARVRFPLHRAAKTPRFLRACPPTLVGGRRHPGACGGGTHRHRHECTARARPS